MWDRIEIERVVGIGIERVVGRVGRVVGGVVGEDIVSLFNNDLSKLLLKQCCSFSSLFVHSLQEELLVWFSACLPSFRSGGTTENSRK